MASEISNTTILLRSKSVAEALTQMFKLKKTQRSSTSLATLSHELGGLSKGFLSDVMRGVKPLPEKHVDAFVRIFRMNTAESRVFQKHVAWEHAATSHKAECLKSLDLERKLLRFLSKKRVRLLQNQFISFQIYAAFGLFKNQPTKQELLKLFSNHSEKSIIDALKWLVLEGFIMEDKKVYRLTDQGMMFRADECDISYLDFIMETIDEAKQVLPLWHQEPKMCLANSFLVSAVGANFQGAVTDFHKKFLDFLTSLESPEGDTLFRFNLQFYPVKQVEPAFKE